MDAPFNQQYYVEGNYDTEVAYKGAAQGLLEMCMIKQGKQQAQGNLSFYIHKSSEACN
jgi:hypothetical protein